MLRAGAQNRATAATMMNDYSSRSHSVFLISVRAEHEATGVVKSGVL